MKRLLLVLPFLFGFDLLQSPNKAVEEGNVRLKSGKAEEALGHYDQAAKSLPADPGVHFDRGAALFALSRFDESVQEFLRATEAKGTPLKAAAFYNLGNALFKTEKYGDAIAAYRRSLVLDPSDVRAKWNLELALKKKKEQDQKNENKDKQNQNKDQNQNQKDQNKDQDQKGDQAKNDQKQDQQKKQDQKDQSQKDQKEEQAKNQDKQDKQPQPQPKDGQQPEKPADMKEIEAVLDNLEKSPKDLEQERARRRMIRRAPPLKDW
jgi:Ca-activated chloride channel homolog